MDDLGIDEGRYGQRRSVAVVGLQLQATSSYKQLQAATSQGHSASQFFFWQTYIFVI